ncbi:Rieske 2Fe-2S domain-containing protein [Galbibacter sp. BG1]|uniref:Rieske 2Fe-2S domain-containing protein n=1 Tax=Galbibacter sp. BG1 TaxID=1170699 RepID=UPI0015BC63BC|nr:Rieske 2Fe-2S domain-containing protein [Galbibacter sp. BG1]QLE02131.1 Rieske 2Fe-2S domain-containing protein [Galbibacter sp. BG1]
MERKKFLKSLGAGAAFALVFPCVSCSSNASDDVEEVMEEDPNAENPDEDNPDTGGDGNGEQGNGDQGGDNEPEKVDFTIDLTTAEAEPLKDKGGFIIKNEIVIARNLEGNFVAATRECPHEGNYQIVYEKDGTDEAFSCSVHGSRYDLSGTPTNNVTSNTLYIYKTELNGDILRIYEE